MDDHDYDEISEKYIDWIIAQGEDLQRPFTVVDADALDDWDAWDEDADDEAAFVDFDELYEWARRREDYNETIDHCGCNDDGTCDIAGSHWCERECPFKCEKSAKVGDE